MPELRQDPTTKEWTIIAIERAKRPADFKSQKDEETEAAKKNCPFCPGRENQSPASHESYLEYYHWFIQVIPRVTGIAGFELGSGIYINTVIPEEGARFLREVKWL
ncbi:hypothetical protein A3J44_04065 [candidate division WOR-1 bacterium RIFCSPHIGHO2_02_FULL_45_12]|uniref:Uncharacterized protein n=1 Tax=candidate division WOR-1 bacterium RIFCSPLOWO2_12_FULL_45_9 TaxID=1802568 RepID=A0A1F4RMX3_UNCSA|nr:MAG: hypothetical protein A3J44_04065 [candidate division WOR-1 bacterium RIFCSPHIGHO2_02_FULL_45_12]OGC09555.1 MAG: hypothetical protein A3F86_04970 [candidate division WOR-1 bacterium RIFCSPLOWO2_12_FULL_45_9]